jgi:DNA-directed RNA polymerase subunit RPC12/RpoP
MSEDVKETIYKCQECDSKFKKTCPTTVTFCQPAIKCGKCGGKLEKMRSNK